MWRRCGPLVRLAGMIPIRKVVAPEFPLGGPKMGVVKSRHDKPGVHWIVRLRLANLKTLIWAIFAN